MTLLKDLINVPERVHQGDFVLKLTDGVERPKETLASYVVTPQLRESFDAALALVGSAVKERTSKAVLLHGSFGSGKSHFMAVLYQLLRHDADARSIPELAPVVAGHDPWLAGKKFLLVPYHMIGAKNLESALFDGYVSRVKKLHPEAPIPEVYLSDRLFEDAKRFREDLGEAAFFSRLNAGKTASGGWGAIGAAWDASSFTAALAAPHGSDARGRLISDLTRTFFTAYQEVLSGSGEGYVPIDLGLSNISRHAKSLGYDGLVLFLDELILWLLTQIADAAFVEREGAKLVKLVESGSHERPVPIVSFVARQRDLKELVGDFIPGAQKLSLADALRYMNDRFSVIKLEDRNLPAIVEKRLLAPKDEAARQLLEQAFSETDRLRPEVMAALLGRKGDRNAFRSVYPFSPALIDTLVAVSSLLQRERTALKLLSQLLVRQRDHLKLGDIVPVGDLYDVLAEGDEPFSQEMKAHFEESRRLLSTKFLPILEESHGMRREEAHSRPMEDPAARRFRADERILKTLLLAALAPEVEALRELSAVRLNALNHGSMTAPIAGGEVQLVARKCREWASQAGALRVSDEPANPVVSVKLTGVEVDAILEKALAEDKPGNRRQKLRELLFSSLGIEDTGEMFVRHEFPWRGTRRSILVDFQNVREVADDVLRVKGDDWKLILDFPFDEAGRSPADDLARLELFRQKGESSQVFCWIPRFFSREAQADLGRLVILDHLLKGDRLRQHTPDLSDVDRAAARAEMENLQAQLKTRIKNDLELAYGLRVEPGSRRIDGTHDLEQLLVSLDESFTPRPPVAADLEEGLRKVVDQLFGHLFPAHPDFGEEVKGALVRKVADELRKAAEAPNNRLVVEKPMRDPLRKVAMPLKLGTMYDDAFVLERHWPNHFERRIAEAEGELTVAQLRRWLDEPKAMGLPRDLQDLVLLTFADQTQRTFFLGNAPFSVQVGSIRDELILRSQQLPAEEVWKKASDRANVLFGWAGGSHRTAANVASLIGTLRESELKHRQTARDLRDVLLGRLQAQGIPEGDSARLAMARAGVELLEAIHKAPDSDLCAAFAGAPVPNPEQALARSLSSAAEVTQALRETRWEVFESALTLPGDYGMAATACVDEVGDALRKYELAVALGPVLVAAEKKALKLTSDYLKAAQAVTPEHISLKPEDTLPPSKPGPASRVLVEEDSREIGDAASAHTLFGELEGKLAKEPGRRLRLSWRIEREDKGR